MDDRIFAPESDGSSLLKDRGSKFLAFAYPCEDLQTGDAYLAELKKKYHDARHHCYAYRLGKGGETTFATDDGEPSHSAGDPILNAIRAEQLTNVWVCVVRYFGGTKLGVRGLIEAYGESALLALQEMERVELIDQVTFTLKFPYDKTSEVSRILHPYEIEEKNAVYTDSVVQTLAVLKEDFPALSAQLEASLLYYEVVEDD